MNRFLALLLFACSFTAHAEQRIYEVKYLSGDRLMTVRNLVNAMLTTGISVQAYPELKVILLNGQPDQVAKAEELLKRYDVPQQPAPPKMQPTLTIYLVRAAATPPDSPRPLPAELDSVIAEMKRSFTYASYSLCDTIMMPPQTTDLESMIPGAHFNGTPYFYALHRPDAFVENDGKTVNVPTLTFTVHVPYGTGIPGTETKVGNSSISTGLKIQEGQKIVLGKVKIDPDRNTDVFLVVTVKLHPPA